MSQDAGERWAAETNRVTLKECRERYLKALAVVEAARKLNERHEARIGVCDDEPGAQLVIKALFAAWAPLGAALAAFDEEAS